MLIECPLFWHLVTTNYRQDDSQRLLSICVDLTNASRTGWPISVRSPRFFQVLKSADRFGGIVFHSRVRFPPPPPHRADFPPIPVCNRKRETYTKNGLNFKRLLILARSWPV